MGLFGSSCDHNWEETSETASFLTGWDTMSPLYAKETDDGPRLCAREVIEITEKCTECDETRTSHRRGDEFIVEMRRVEDDDA